MRLNLFTILSLVSHTSPFCPVNDAEHNLLMEALRLGYVREGQAGWYTLTDMGKGYINGFADRADLNI